MQTNTTHAQCSASRRLVELGRALAAVLVLLPLWAADAGAASPNFSSSSPANANVNIAQASNISATFDQAIAAGTVSSSTFVVHGGFVGKHATGGAASTHRDGTYTGGGTTTLTFDPGKNFYPGELVSATLTTGLQNAGAEALATAKVFQFRAAASAGPARFSNDTSDVGTATNATLSVLLGDVDGDGDLDLVTGNNNRVNRVYLGSGNGAFASGTDVDTPTNSTLSASLGDLDGDGDLDLVTGNFGQANRVYLGSGNGAFASGTDVDTPTNSTYAVSLGDLDGDGDLDLIAGNDGQANRVYLGVGNGTFASGNDVDTPTNSTYAVSLGDVDGDGDLDLVTGNENQVNRVYLGVGNGTFASGTDVDTPTNSTWAISLGDLDGDGDLDLITGNSGQVNRVYLGSGNGTFASGTDVDTPTNSTRSLSLGDVDGDGDLDLITGNSGQVNRVYLGSGNGTFASGTDVDTPTNQTYAVSLGDVDGDGDLDLVTGNLSQVNRVYLNSYDKDGTLTASATLDESSAIDLPSTATTAGAAVDLFDFALSDGGSGDGASLSASQVVVNTSGTGPFAKVTWLLNGPDASNVSGTYSSGGNTITFSGLSISVADGASETYTLRGYYNDTAGLTEGATFSFSLDGDTDVSTVSATGSSMSGSNAAVTNAAAARVGVTATQLGFVTQPSPLALTSQTQLDFSTDPVVAAQDASGNTDADFTGAVTLAENGSGSSSFGNNSVSAVGGLATFSGLLLTYTATADHQTFGLTAAASGLTGATSSNLSADVVATQLGFTTQPGSLTSASGSQLAFSTVPVVAAQDGNGVTDTDYAGNIALANAGAGASTLSISALAPTSGAATFTGLLLNYDTSDAGSIALAASASGLTAATSASVPVMPLVANNRGARIGENGTVTLTANLLQFTDAASTASQIVYTIGNAPSVGEIRNNGSALAAGGTFTQDDIDNGRVSYTHLGREIFGDGFTYTVAGNPGVVTETFDFGFTVGPDNDTPFFAVRSDLGVDEGGAITITNGSLRALDADHLAGALIYEVTTAPAHGRLNMGSFTQEDIDRRRLTYQHDGSEAASDTFAVRVRDAEGNGRAARLAIAVRPINDAPVIQALADQALAEGEVLSLPVAISDAEGDDFTATLDGLPAGASLAAGALTWVPTYDQAGRYTAVITAADGRGGRSQRRLAVVVAEAAPPILALPLIDFGAVQAGQTVERRYTLRNPANLPLEIGRAAHLGGAFALVAPDLPLSLAPGATFAGTVRFTPRTGGPGPQRATLVCPTNLGPIEIPVAGRSLWGGLAFDQMLIDFGPVPLGASRRKHLKVHNPGNVPVTVESVGSDQPAFTATPSEFTLAPGASRFVHIDYAPGRQTREVSLLRLRPQGLPARAVPLQGTGVEPPQGFVHIDFDPAALDQGQRALGAVAPGDVVTAQLVIERAPEIVGWTARIDFDPAQISYVAGSFTPGSFIPGLQGLADVGGGVVEVGGQMLGSPAARPQFGAGQGVLGTVSFRVEAGFAGAADLAVTRVRLRRLGHDGVAVEAVRSPALLSAALLANPELPPDFDGDGAVAFEDFFAFADAFGQSAAAPGAAPFDLTGDGRVDFEDFFAFADAFGQTAAGKRVGRAAPPAAGLGANYPNPFNAETVLPYALAGAGHVRLAIYDIAGQTVRVLVDETKAGGRYRTAWDGRDASGRSVGSGMYIARLVAEGRVFNRKLLLVR